MTAHDHSLRPYDFPRLLPRRGRTRPCLFSSPASVLIPFRSPPSRSVSLETTAQPTATLTLFFGSNHLFARFLVTIVNYDNHYHPFHLPSLARPALISIMRATLFGGLLLSRLAGAQDRLDSLVEGEPLLYVCATFLTSSQGVLLTVSTI